MKRVLIIVCCFFAAVCYAQAQRKSLSPGSARSKIDCGKSKGCAIFKEMLQHNDPDFRLLGNSSTATLMCFSDIPSDDSFFMLSYAKPSALFWTPPESTTDRFEHAPDMVTFDDYSNGLAGRSEYVFVDWRRPFRKHESPSSGAVDVSLYTRAASGGDNASGVGAEINESTVKYLNEFTNRDNETVEYSVQVRRSTGRYEQLFKSPTFHQSESGRCITF